MIFFLPTDFKAENIKPRTVFTYFHLEIHTILHCHERITLSRNIIIFSVTNVLFQLKLLPWVLKIIKDIIFPLLFLPGIPYTCLSILECNWTKSLKVNLAFKLSREMCQHTKTENLPLPTRQLQKPSLSLLLQFTWQLLGKLFVETNAWI